MKYAHIDTNNILLGWYSDDVHGMLVQAVYEDKIMQEEQKDEEGNIIQEEIKESVLIKESYYDVSNIPTPNIEVTEEVWKEALSINANYYENGKFVHKDFRTDDEKEKARVENINSYTQSIITKKYPLEKQSSANLGIYGDEYKNEMINFISNCITLSNEAIENGTSFEDYKGMLDE